MHQNCEDNQLHQKLKDAIEQIKFRFSDVLMSINIDINQKMFTEVDFYNCLTAILLGWNNVSGRRELLDQISEEYPEVISSIYSSISDGYFSEKRFDIFCKELSLTLTKEGVMNKEEKERELRELFKRMIEVLMLDESVVSKLRELGQNGAFGGDQLFGMVIRVSDLLEMVGSTPNKEPNQNAGENTTSEKKQTGKSSSSDAHSSQKNEDKAVVLIDGIELSENEIAFEEYAIEEFDEEKWLEKFHLTWKAGQDD